MIDHTLTTARTPLRSGADGSWSVARRAVPAASFPDGNAATIGTVGVDAGIVAPAYVPSVSIAA